MRVISVTAVAALLAAGTVAGPAGGGSSATRTIQLGWSEQAPATGAPIMTLRVERLVIDGQKWRLTASFTNRSGMRLGIEPRFKLLIGPTRGTNNHVIRVAKRFTPAMPKSIAPGKSWRGTWHGEYAGVLKPGRFLRIGFDRFVGEIAPGLNEFGLITDNVKKL